MSSLPFTPGALPGVVFAAVYVLAILYKRTMTGPVTEQSEKAFTGRDLTGIEKAVMVPIIAMLLFFGFVPQPAVSMVEPTAKATMEYVGVTDPAPVVKGAK